MPPRKKTKRTHSTSPPEDAAPTQSSANTPGSTDSAEKPDEPDYDLISDPWTDEQETALLKAVVKWKPVGVHKHFRMLAISEYLRSQGYAPSNAEHMRIPGIWKKLATLYNLEALDEREDAFITDMNEDEEEISEKYCPFELPYDEYGDMMFEKRLALEGSSSPITSPHPESRQASVVGDTDEPRSSPAPSRGRKSNRGTRQAGRETRSTKLQVEIGTDSQEKASDDDDDDDDAESAEGSVANEEEEEGEDEDGEDEDGADETKDSDGDEEDDSQEKGGSRSTRAKTSRSKQKDKKASSSTGTRRTARRR